MFGFGNRKRFNGDVDVKLNNEYQLSTRGNPDFPSLSVYLQTLDVAWQARMNSDEGALYMAILIFSGLAKTGKFTEGMALFHRIRCISDLAREHGLIGRDHWLRFERAISDTEDIFPSEMRIEMNSTRQVHLCRAP